MDIIAYKGYNRVFFSFKQITLKPSVLLFHAYIYQACQMLLNSINCVRKAPVAALAKKTAALCLQAKCFLNLLYRIA